MTLDDKLSWKPYIFNLCKNLASVVFVFGKLKSSVSIGTLLLPYYGLFHSRLNYGIGLWGYSGHAENFFKWQKHAIRI